MYITFLLPGDNQVVFVDRTSSMPTNPETLNLKKNNVQTSEDDNSQIMLTGLPTKPEMFIKSNDNNPLQQMSTCSGGNTTPSEQLKR